jgi:LacI family transcriptional regulator
MVFRRLLACPTMPQPARRIRKVALLVEWSRVFGRGVLQGIGKYVQAHGNWKVYHTERKLSETAPRWLRGWRGDGIIARIENRRLATQIKRLGLPVVDLFEQENLGDVPTVLTDNAAIARLAAEPLLERGLTQFAYCGLPGVYDQRAGHFAQYLANTGYEVSVYMPHQRHRKSFIDVSEGDELGRENALTQWLRRLPKPVGLMACNDLRAHQILMACADGKLAVPEEVAVIGVDNDEVICGLTRPSLSSVEQNPGEIGYQAAALLGSLMDGEASPRKKLIVAPRGVVARQSTDLVAVSDPDVATALHYIREHACEGISVDDVLTHSLVSRRTLERRFAELLGRSPGDEIARVRLAHLKRLLLMTDYPLAKIAELTGFEYVESMCAIFKKTTGQTLGQYRRDHRSTLGTG